MHYYIDGYNMLFQMLRAEEDLQKSRQEIIRELHLKTHLLQITITMVFDGSSSFDEGERSHYRDLEIFFSSQGQTADDLLLQFIKKSSIPESCVVITNDRCLSLAVRRSGGKTETVGRFLSWINKRYKNALQKGRGKKRFESKLKKQDVAAQEIVCEKGSEAGSIDYYLAEFEKRLQDEPREEMKNVKPERKKKNKPQVEKKERDFDRWLKAFTQMDEDIK